MGNTTGIDPLSLSVSAAQFGIGSLQSVFGGGAAKKATKQLEALEVPKYDGSKSINDYYTTILNRANVSPYESAGYKMQEQNAGRNLNAGLSFLNSKRSGLAGIGGLVAGQNDAMQRAGVAAVADQNTRVNQLGNATSMKNADDRFAFDQNVMAPFQKNLQLLSLKAKAGNDKMNAGFNNMFGGLTSGALIAGNQMGGYNGGMAQGSANGNPSEWDRYMNEYRGRTGNSSWDSRTALPINDFRIS